MASMLFAYKGRSLSPSVNHHTGFGTASFCMRIDAEIEKRGLEWWLSLPEAELQAFVQERTDGDNGGPR